MLLTENFTEKHIRKLQTESKRDPALLERTVYAFGLLEAITKVGMPFIFKGGTCLMLLLKEPHRLSTDIDIIVEPDTDVEMYIAKAAEIFPFIRFDEQKRVGKNNIEKKHYKFTYDSLINGKKFYILLDVLFEHNQYEKVETREIRNSLLLTQPEYMSVKVPSIESILGDKLTAFAPHTTGIPLNVGKDMEVMKQLYDVSTLLDEFDDFEDVKITYEKVALAELEYRGVELSAKECVKDTFDSALCIASRGKILPDEYSLYVNGIRDLRGHIYSENYSPEIAVGRATKVMYIAACLMADVAYERVEDYREFLDMKLSQSDISSLKYLRKANPEAFAYAIKTDRILADSRK